VTLKNRIMGAPMSIPELTEDYFPTAATVGYYEARAKGGAASVCVGDCVVHRETGMAHAGLQIAFDDPRIARDMARIAQAIKWHDAIPSIELTHGGMFGGVPCLANPTAKGKQSYGPVDFVMENGIVVKAMDEDMMHMIAQAFADSAKRAKMCGYEMIIFHGGHGWMFNQFLSPYTNRRTDQYGGSTENRCRFPIMILKAVREAVGPNFPLDFRMSGTELFEGGYGIDEGCRIAEVLQDYLDIIHISVGNHERLEVFPHTHPTLFLPHGVNVEYAAEIKKHVKIPVATLGGISDPDMAEEIIGEQSADLCAIARGLLADPDMLKKCYRGKPEEVRPCLRCWGCAGNYASHVQCAVNPALGRTGKYARVQKADEKKKVVVIGGGVAGCQAAQTLIQRGHEVVLFEKNDALGGLLFDISTLPFKNDLRQYARWLVRTTMNCGARIYLGTRATADNVMAEKPDAIVVACGSYPVLPEIPGIRNPNVFNVLDVDAGRVKLSGKVVVCGGGISGCESALGLALEGCSVTVVDMIPETRFAEGVMDITRTMLLSLLHDNHVTFLGDHIVRSIDENGVHIEGRDWSSKTLEADFVVESFGMASDRETADLFTELIPEVYVVGDALEVRNIKHCTLTAYNCCCNI
jgi:2,4-dienoyl-CoA reductase-like NADH-dependent reductase (Old Yellow Enzyme family)/thioredoxin reductase